MTYLLIGVLLVLLVAQLWDHGRQLNAERAHSSSLVEQVRELTNQIVLLKVEPKTAAFVAASDVEIPYQGALTDEELAELELERIGADS